VGVGVGTHVGHGVGVGVKHGQGGHVGAGVGVGGAEHESVATAPYPLSPFGCVGVAKVWYWTPEQSHETENAFAFPGAGSGRKFSYRTT
jgi:hypothetical protein